jgi:DNA modification methylase
MHISAEINRGAEELMTTKMTRKSDGLKKALTHKSKRRRKLTDELAKEPIYPIRNDISPKLSLVQVSLDDLKIPTRNVRRIDMAHVVAISQSIRSLGFSHPPIIDQDNFVIDGVSRIEGAKLAGLRTVTCVKLQQATAKEKRLLRIALNRLAEKGGWNIEELKIEFTELTLEDAPIEITGFTQVEIDQIQMDDVLSAEPGPLEPEDKPTVTRPGDVFDLEGGHTIVCGDSTDPGVVKAAMDDELARFILTDQPYNVPISGHVSTKASREFLMGSGEMTDAEFEDFNTRYLDAALPFLCDGGMFGTFIDWRGYRRVLSAAERLQLVPVNLAIWVKSNAGMGSFLRSRHELFPMFKKGTKPHVNNIELGRHGRWRSNVWMYAGASAIGSDSRKGLKYHPTVKPIAMLEDAILDCTLRDEIVLDPFAGSGSTLLAALRSGRRCRCIELDPRYVDVIVRRYQAFTGKQAVHRSTGQKFDTLAQARATSPMNPTENLSGLSARATNAKRVGDGQPFNHLLAYNETRQCLSDK